MALYASFTYFLIPLILIILPLILIFFIKKLKRRNKKLPPGPPKLPIIGNLHQLGSLAHQSLWRLSQEYGPVMFLKLGGVPTIIISSAESAKEILKVHDLDCCSRPLLAGTGKLSYNYLDVAFSPYGEYWREVRKICTLELFGTKRVQSFQNIREEEVGFLVDSLADSLGCVVDLSRMFLKLTANITCRVGFGKNFRKSGFDGERFQETIHEAMAMLGCRSGSDFFPVFGWIIDRFTGLHARLEKSFRELDGFYQEVIDDHLNSSRVDMEEDDIIDVLLRIEREQTESDLLQLTKNHIKAILMNVFLAGVDTGAITLVWTLAELVRKPRLMKKAQDEIRTCIGNKGKVSESELHQFQYLKNVVKETLRLHPPGVLLIPRETISHFKLNGYDIEPKTRIHVNVWGIGRDPKAWKDPEEFWPERFNDSLIDYKGQHFELLPFGAGRRGCPGIYMGTVMVELALANLLYAFDWKLPEGMKEEDLDMEEAAGQTVYKKLALCLVPVAHHSA